LATVFPLIPRRRVLGLAFGGVRSVRRGVGSDVASTREYRPGDDVGTLRRAVAAVFVHEAVARWMVDVVRTTRQLELVAIGSSVRGTLALNRTARAWALLHGRRYVTPDDVEQLFVPVLLHRILFRPSFLAEIRDRGWDAAAAEVRARTLERAPKPGFDIDLDVPAPTGT
jgi:MoxR-like ATPase